MLLLKNARYLNEHLRIATGDLVIDDGVIRIPETNGPEDGPVLDCTDYIVIPGLINAHFHGYSLSAKGIAKDMNIQDWCNHTAQGRIQQAYFDRLDRLTSDEYKTLIMKAYIDMVKKGVTFVSESEPGNWPDVAASALNAVGMRGVVDTYDKIGDYHDRRDGRVAFASHLLEEEDMTDEALDVCMEIRDLYDPPFLTHCMENSWRKELVYATYGRSSVQLYKERGLLGSKTVLFHGVHLEQADYEAAAEANASVVHCPVTNLWTGAGIAPVGAMLDGGVNVCLGTDYGSADMWETMRTAYYLLKSNPPAHRFQAEDIFRMATRNGAAAYGEASLGIIKDGFAADLTFIRRNPLISAVHGDEFSTVIHNLLFETREECIDHVMIGGEWAMYDRQLTKVDEEAVDAEYGELLAKLYGAKEND